MELYPVEEVFEVNSNSTANTLKEQRLERNKELRLKAYLVSRCPVKNQQKDCNSESSSEFPASSPSNPQMQRKSHYLSRPPLLKNTLPADAFERGLALIATKKPQMTMNEKIESWDCNIDDLSDVEDVVNFDAIFEQHEQDKMKMRSRNIYDLKSKSSKGNNDLDQLANDACYTFTEFQRRLLAIDPRKNYFQCNEQKQNSKLTSEEDEKPTTSNNCLLRNRDTPLKKRACKYKRAADPIAHLPNKKSSSSDTPRDGASCPKKKVQPHKLTAANVGNKNLNEKLLCPSNSDISSQHANLGTNARHTQTQQSQTKSKSLKIMEPTDMDNKWNINISTNNTARNEQESFFRWRRLSREIDKIGRSSIDPEKNSNLRRNISSSPPRAKKDLIEIRYDFIDSNDVASKATPESNAYNVVIKSLKKEEHDCNNIIPQNSIAADQEDSKKPDDSIEKTEELDMNEEFLNTLNKNYDQELGTEFHQQHEFCNYLGLTGMSTANAMANAAAELLKCNLARRSLRVRHLEQIKAKTKNNIPSENILGKNNKEKHEIIQEVREYQNFIDTTLKNSNSSERSEAKENYKFYSSLYPSASCGMEETKEKEAKIKILCQISSTNETKDEEISNESVKSLYKPIRFTPQKMLDDFKLNSEQIDSTNSGTKYIELRSKIPSERHFNIKEEPNEVQELHEKFQEYLKEARKAVPNIFIVQSLDNTLVSEKPKQEINDNNNALEIENQQSSKQLKSLQSNKSSQTNQPKVNVEKKQRRRQIFQKKSSVNKRLCTRSMLNLNQQRELRNRNVILKLLKTYSSIKVKVRNSKVNGGLQTKKKKQNDYNDNIDEKKYPLKSTSTLTEPEFIEDLKILNINEEQETELPLDTHEENIIENNESNNDEEPKIILFENHDHIYSSMMIDEPCTPLNAEDKKYPSENATLTIDEDHLNHQNYLNSNNFFDVILESGDDMIKTIDAAVQTDPEAFIENLPVFFEIEECKTEESIHLLKKINVDMDVSSSDIVTSTTSGMGDQNRFETKNSPNLVNKKCSSQEQTVAVLDDTSASQLIGLSNPNPNISINSSTVNELEIQALRQPSKPLRNPLQESAGSVLHIYYESDILIVIQKTLISFWKYIRVLNALLGEPSPIKTDELHVKHNQEMLTQPPLETSIPTVEFNNSTINDTSSSRVDECDWIFLGELHRLNRDIQIGAPFVNRMCASESRPVYLEMFCRELLNEYRECNLLSCYVNVYFYNEEDQMAMYHSIQLDSIQSLPTDVMYTAINDSRYFVLAWPQANVVGKDRSGLCKYALSPEHDMLATTRDFKAMRHILRSLECLNDGKLVGFGDSQLTVWDHRSGDVLMNYDLEMPIGRNLGTIYYPSFESGQNNVIIMIQHIQNEKSSELAMIACSISHLNPSRRVLLRYNLMDKKISNISGCVNNGEHLIIQTGSGEEILISCNDPRQMMFLPEQESIRFYTRGRTQVVELTNQTLTVDTFSSYLLKTISGLKTQKSIAEKKSINKISCV